MGSFTFDSGMNYGGVITINFWKVQADLNNKNEPDSVHPAVSKAFGGNFLRSN